MRVPQRLSIGRLDKQAFVPALLDRAPPERARAWVVATAVGLFAAVFLLRLSVTSDDARIFVLNAIPIALLSLECGTRGGVAGATIATVSVALWSSIEGTQLSVMAYVPRVVMFFLVGLLAGHLAERLSRARDAQAGLLELAPGSALAVDLDGHVTMANSAAQGFFGYGADELTGLPVDQLVPDFFTALRRSLLRSERMDHFLLTACSKDRRQRLVHARVEGLGSDAGVLLVQLQPAEAL